MQRVLAGVLCFLLLVGGCSKGAAPLPTSPEGVPPGLSLAPVPSPEPATPTDAMVAAIAAFLPQDEHWYSYRLDDETEATEYYVRDGERLVGTYNGKTYVTWLITQEGVWRQDPKGQVLLRYLPPQLKDQTAWKQTSGSTEVWFRLNEVKPCPQAGDAACWDLTVLNRLERTRLRFSTGGIVYARAENWTDPRQSFTKELLQAARGTAPPREQILADAVTRPPGSLPAVTEVSVQQFEQALKSMLQKAGRPVLEVDLDGDGRMERVEGRLGVWHSEPLEIYNGYGVLEQYPTITQLPDGSKHRLDLVQVGDRKALLYQHGAPETWHSILLWFGDGAQLHPVWGWLPKTDRAWGSSAKVESDGTILVGSNAADLAGYSLTRRYRINHDPGASGFKYTAQQIEENVTVGPHPTSPADLLTAALMARWYRKEAELGRYLPDPKVREAFLASQIDRPRYVPMKAQLGRLVWKSSPGWPKPVPAIQPADLDENGATEFHVGVGQYEGYNYYTGRVAFGRDAEGRLTIKSFELQKTGFVF